MNTISEYMTHDHRRCDELFAGAENAAGNRDRAACMENFHKLREAMEHHFSMEEELLFPAFERRTGMTQGPTQVMRMEHRQMRDLFRQMAESLEGGDEQAFLGHSETLLIMMQQHNLKEEQVLYPMSDRALADQSAELIGRMDQLKDPQAMEQTAP